MDTQSHGDDPSFTCFAPAERATVASLKTSMDDVIQNPVINALLQMVNGFLAVLNEQRQILLVNDNLLQYAGIEHAGAILGLRPGEFLECTHAHDEPGGCGTGRACQTCGAVIAMVASLASNKAVQGNCFLTSEKGGTPLDLYFQVNCNPISIADQRYLLLFLRDTTINQQRAALERSFFHDMNNIVGALSTTCELLAKENNPAKIGKMVERIGRISSRILKELDIQRTLSASTPRDYELSYETTSIGDMMQEVMEIFQNHGASQGKNLDGIPPEPDILIDTDTIRILVNMLVNAFEATDEGGHVRFWTKTSGDGVAFHVWNSQAIP
jgi:K+-sensing histidine kinase KdpD